MSEPSSLVFYNDNDAYCAQWLRNLGNAGLLPVGIVDERSILDIEPSDLAGYSECHFFAGIGGWPYALSLAGWRGPVWTGSCPCQPLSSAGQQRGHADERHLWPAFYALIGECRPATVFGEQVASKDGREWLAGVRADLEHLGYAIGAADLSAAGIGAPHIRQRLFWVAQSASARCNDTRQHNGGSPSLSTRPVERGTDGGMADACGERRQQINRGAFGDEGADEGWAAPSDHVVASDGADSRLGNASSYRSEISISECGLAREAWEQGSTSERSSRLAWADAIWLPCLDGNARRVEPSIFPLAHGVPARVGRLRAYGNAIVPQVAAEFISAWMDCHECR